MRNHPNAAQTESHGIGPRKTLFVMVTVVGCIAILWPKVFYPMMFGTAPKQSVAKDHRGTACCDVVLDREAFMNVTTAEIGPQLYRKRLNLITGEMSLRQERPPHLRPDAIHPAMRERGRAIPSTPTVPIVERSKSSPPPRIVEGRPGPIPGMRPPLGAGSVHQAQPKSGSMGFIMPLYTVGIVAFFIYTIMKILFKKPVLNAPYGPTRPDPTFRKEVFGQTNSGRRSEETIGPKIGCNHQHVHDSRNCGQKHANGDISSTSYSNRSAQQCVVKATTNGMNGIAGSRLEHGQEREQLMEIEKLRIKLEETEKAMARLIAEMNCDRYKAKGQCGTFITTFFVFRLLISKETQTSKLKQAIFKAPSGFLTRPVIVVTAIQGLIDAADEHLKQRENSSDLSKETDNAPQNGNISNGHAKGADGTEPTITLHVKASQDIKKEIEELIKSEQNVQESQKKKREESVERTVKVLGMELTASCEGGRRWNRPPTPVFISHPEHSNDEAEQPEPQSIYLEGALPHESQILVADSEIRTENVIDKELNGTPEEPAVVLSSKMTLSLINLSSSEDSEDKPKESTSDKDESPLDEDMEIINGEEKEEKTTEE